MKRISLFLFAIVMAFAVNAEQIQNLTVKVKNAEKVTFSWFSTNPSTTQFKVEILDASKTLVASLTNDKDYWNDWQAFFDDYTPTENEHYASSQYILRHTYVVKGDAWNKSTTALGGYEYGLVEGTYFIVVTGLGSDNSVTEEAATLEVVIKQVQQQEDENGNIQLNIIGFEAALITPSDFSDIDRPFWLLLFYTGADETSDGYPIVWITIDSGKEDAISGTYSKALNNVLISPDNNCFVDLDGSFANYQWASDVELNVDFVSFYQPYVYEGYHYGVYSGSFKMPTEGGKTYIASFNNMLCNSFTYATLNMENAKKEYVGMYGEDMPDSIDNISEPSAKPVKVVENGNIFILRNGKRYSIMGAEVK